MKFKLGIFAKLKEFFLTVVCFDGYDWSKSKVEIKNEEGSLSPFLAESTRSQSTQSTKMGNGRKSRCLRNF